MSLHFPRCKVEFCVLTTAPGKSSYATSDAAATHAAPWTGSDAWYTGWPVWRSPATTRAADDEWTYGAKAGRTVSDEWPDAQRCQFRAATTWANGGGFRPISKHGRPRPAAQWHSRFRSSSSNSRFYSSATSNFPVTSTQ